MTKNYGSLDSNIVIKFFKAFLKSQLKRNKELTARGYNVASDSMRAIVTRAADHANSIASQHFSYAQVIEKLTWCCGYELKRPACSQSERKAWLYVQAELAKQQPCFLPDVPEEVRNAS